MKIIGRKYRNEFTFPSTHAIKILVSIGPIHQKKNFFFDFKRERIRNIEETERAKRKSNQFEAFHSNAQLASNDRKSI